METVREIATCVSVSAAAVGALYMLCPDGKMNRSMKYVLALLLLTALVTPFLRVQWEEIAFESEESKTYASGELLNGQAEYLISELLKQKGIAYEEIKVKTDISEPTDISISSVHIYGASDAAAAEQAVKENFGISEVKAE